MSINLINIQTGSSTPSPFGMPLCAPAFGIAAPVAQSAPTYVVRDRSVAGALVKGATQGLHAWSPPIC
jgi:hypothetical protein